MVNIRVLIVVSGLRINAAFMVDWNLNIFPNPQTLKFQPTGANLYVICEVTGVNTTAQPKVQWYMNGHLVRTDKFAAIRHTTTFHLKKTLSIKNASAKDSGLFTCNAELNGIHKSAGFVMKFYGPVNFGKTMTEQQVQIGKDARVFCKAVGENMEISWLYNGTKIEGRPRKYVYEDQNRTLVIPSFCSCQDNGVYTCLVKQQDKFDSVNITVTGQYAKNLF